MSQAAAPLSLAESFPIDSTLYNFFASGIVSENIRSPPALPVKAELASFLIFCISAVIVAVGIVCYSNRLYGAIITGVVNAYTWRQSRASFELGKDTPTGAGSPAEPSKALIREQVPSSSTF
jgi:hypothetical protein